MRKRTSVMRRVLQLTVLVTMPGTVLPVCAKEGNASFYGVVESRPSGSGIGNWQIGGKTVSATSSTLISSGIAVNSCVEVEGISQADGSVKATKIKLEDGSRCSAGGGSGSGGSGGDGGSGSGGSGGGSGSGGSSSGSDDFGMKFYGTVQTLPAGGIGTWQISGRLVTVSASTPVAAGVAVGSCVEVQGRLQADGSLAASKIGVEDGARCGGGVEQEEPHFFGNIANLPASGLIGDWTVSGRTVHVLESTEIRQNRGPVTLGACVEIEGSVDVDNSINARQVGVESGAAGCATSAGNMRLEVEFTGLVQTAPQGGLLAGTWQIAGRMVKITAATEFPKGLPLQGSCVEVKGSMNSDGTVTAVRVQTEDHGCGAAMHLSFDGTVQSLPTGGLAGDWQVSGRTVKLTEATILEITAGFATGACVEVQGGLAADGSINAVKIESKSASDCSGAAQGLFEVEGTVQSGPASGTSGDWTIAGRTVKVTPSTVLDTEHGALAIGACVEAKGTLQSDGALAASGVEVRSASGTCLFRDGVLSAASFTSASLAPGQIVSLFGTNVGTSTDRALEVSDDRLTKRLGNVRVLFDGVAAPLVFVSANQVNAIVPFAVKGRGETEVQIENNGAWSNSVRVKVMSSAPSVFTATQSGRGQGAVLNFESERQEYTANGEDNAARRGSTIVIYGTGHGEFEGSNSNDDGWIATTAVNTALPVKVRIGEREAEVEYAGSAPGLVNGVFQVNVRVPDDAPVGGKVPLVVTVGDRWSQDGVTVAVK